MTIVEVKAKHKLTDEQVADYADKYVRGRERQRKLGANRRADMAEFRKWKESQGKK